MKFAARAVLVISISPVWSQATDARGVQRNPGSLIVGDDLGGRPISFTAAEISNSYLEKLVLRVAASVRLAAGIERIAGDFEPPAGSNPRTGPEVQLTGLTVDQALLALTKTPTSTPYRLAWSGRTPIVSAFARTRTFLDTVVPRFDLADATLTEGVIAVHRLFDTKFAYQPGPTSSSLDPDSSEGQRREALFNKRFSLHLENATARDILSAMVTANGDSSWIVRYRSLRGEYAGAEIAISTFEGMTRTLPAVVR